MAKVGRPVLRWLIVLGFLGGVENALK